MRHENDLHTIRVQTMAVSSVGNSKIIEEIVDRLSFAWYELGMANETAVDGAENAESEPAELESG